MSDQSIQALENACEELEKYLKLDVNGDGNNLHDIKNSFDYVIKTIRTINLEETGFGETQINRVQAISDVLSELWRAIDQLTKSIKSFCANQRMYNNMH